LKFQNNGEKLPNDFRSDDEPSLFFFHLHKKQNLSTSLVINSSRNYNFTSKDTMNMNGILKNKTRADKKKRQLPAFLARPLRLVGERTGLSLTSALRNKNKSKKNSNKGAFTIDPKKRNNASSTPPSVNTDVPGVLSASASDTSESTATNTPTSFESLEHDFLPSSNSACIFTPLSEINAQELFLSPLPEPVHRKTVRFDMPLSPEAVDQSSPTQQEEGASSDLTLSQHQPRILSLASLQDVSPRSLETILEVANEEDNLSVSSTASSNTGFQVSFSPTNDLFLRTLAMERAKALSMSELSIKAESLCDDVSDNSSILSQFLHHFRQLDLNDQLGLLILVLLLLHCTGTSELVICTLQTASRQFWVAIFSLILPEATTISPNNSPFYDMRNEPIGVWLR
jgi:hypothetical protein